MQSTSVPGMPLPAAAFRYRISTAKHIPALHSAISSKCFLAHAIALQDVLDVSQSAPGPHDDLHSADIGQQARLNHASS